jgi:hypothetical protein
MKLLGNHLSELWKTNIEFDFLLNLNIVHLSFLTKLISYFVRYCNHFKMSLEYFCPLVNICVGVLWYPRNHKGILK